MEIIAKYFLVGMIWATYQFTIMQFAGARTILGEIGKEDHDLTIPITLLAAVFIWPVHLTFGLIIKLIDINRFKVFDILITIALILFAVILFTR